MKKIFSKQSSMRASMVLLATMLLTLTAQTAWADDPDLGFITTTPTVDGGQATNWASNEDYGSLVDGNTSTKYGISNADPYVEFHYASAITPKGYALWTASDSNGERNPQSWTIKAKNSGDAGWTTLATVDNTSGDKLPMANDTRTVFALNNSTAYTHFRFEATRASNGAFQLAELQFCTVSPTPYIQYATISGENSCYFYTGSAISISPTVTAAGGTPLTLGTHFTAKLNSNNVGTFPFTVTDKGNYTLTIEGIGSYSGSKTINFTVSDCPEGLSIDDSYTKGQDGYYYVNMPQTGSKTLTIPDGFSYKFKVYDSGGKGGSGLALYGSAPNYPNNCSGTLVLNVPNDYVLRLTGRINTESRDKFTVYNSNQADNSKKLIDAITSTTNGVWYEIPTVASTSNSMTIYFYSDGVSNSDGLDLTVALAQPNDLSIATITKQDTYWWNNGTAIDIDYTVKAVNGTTLVKGTDYTETIKKGGVVVSEGVKDLGDYTLTIIGINSYIGEQTVNFTVAKDICLYGVISGESGNKTMTLKYDDFNADPASAANNEKRKYTPGSSAWWNRCDETGNKSIVIDASCQNYQGTSLQSLFYNWSNVTSITGLENLNYHNTVTDMSQMFYQCYALTTLDASGLNTTTVTRMTSMFFRCSALTTINFGDGTKFNTSLVTNMNHMFNSCSALTVLDLSSFSTPALGYVDGMFYKCSNLQTIIVSSTGWSVAGVSLSTPNVFDECSAIVGEQGTTYNSSETYHDRAHIDGGTSNPGYLTGRYTITYNTNGGTMPTDPYVTNFTGKDNVIIDLPTPTRTGYAFAGWYESSALSGTAITSYPANTRGNKTLYAKWALALYAVVSGETMTLKCGDPSSEPGSVTYNGSSTWNTGFNSSITTVVVDASCQNYAGTTLHGLFNACTHLTTITGLDYLNTENVIDMSSVFYNCHALTSVDVSKFNTSKVRLMPYMFYSCQGLTTLDVSSFNTAEVADMTSLFGYCDHLTTIDIRNFNTGKVWDMKEMFRACTQLTTIIVGEGWSTAKVTSSNIMFQSDNNLVGQNGTACNGTNNLDATYACVDAAGTPGYLSLGLNEATGIVNAAAYTGKKAQFTRTFTGGKASTVCLPFSFTPDAGIGTFYTLFAIDKTTTPYWTVTMQAEVTTAPLAANTPYLLVATSTGALNFSGTVSSVGTEMKSADVADPEVSGGKWNLIGTYSDISWTSDGPNAADLGSVYGFAAKDYGTEVHAGDFVKAASGAGISPFRAYLKYTAPSSARSVTRGEADELPARITVRLIGANGDTTAIGTMDTRTGEISFDSWYTLDGTRLSGKPSAKGVYVNNGKKIVIK